jgi:hypothetical protein
MSSSTRLHRAIAIIPLAVLSAAWTANLAGVGVDPASADPDGSQTLPDGTVLPTAAIEAPASVGDAVTRAAALTPGTASDIPQAALSAYQRAEAVINEADKGCNLPWELVAAIGRVESDHGRYGGNVLTDEGVSKPGVYGIALNGKNGTQAIQDTDGGALDKDTVYDRAVGAMQFIPGTWSVVKVDADGDGKRNPQDIDDSSLATAVYLCSGSDDLGTRKGQEAGVFRYNHSTSYVDLVLRIMAAYQSGDYTAVPTGASGGTVFSPSSSTTMKVAKAKAKAKKKQQSSSGSGGSSSSSSGTGTTGTTGGTTGGTGGAGGALPSGGSTTGSDPVGDATKAAGGTVTKITDPVTSAVPKVLSQAEAVAACLAKGLVNNPLSSSDPFDKCVFNLTH